MKIRLLLATVGAASLACAWSAMAQPPPKPPFIDPVEIHRFTKSDLQTPQGLDAFRAALERDHSAGRLGSNPTENDDAYRIRIEILDEMRREMKTHEIEKGLEKADKLAENGNASDYDAIIKGVSTALAREGHCHKLGIDCSFKEPPGKVVLKYREKLLRNCDARDTRLTRAFVLKLERSIVTSGGSEAPEIVFAKCYEFLARAEKGTPATITGKVHHIRKPFGLSIAIPGGKGTMSFKPANEQSGTVSYKIQGPGVTDSGPGTYTLSIVAGNKDGKFLLTSTTHGCVRMPSFQSCADRTAHIELTPK